MAESPGKLKQKTLPHAQMQVATAGREHGDRQSHLEGGGSSPPTPHGHRAPRPWGQGVVRAEHMLSMQEP